MAGHCAATRSHTCQSVIHDLEMQTELRSLPTTKMFIRSFVRFLVPLLQFVHSFIQSVVQSASQQSVCEPTVKPSLTTLSLGIVFDVLN